MDTSCRHCASCLKSLLAGTVKRCARCHRRAYCSRECQSLDWNQERGSQGHKNWCHLEYGEEDIDWEVKQAPGKGLGVFAKRAIPAHYRIMVDAVSKPDHPAINDLMPINGTIQQKLDFNGHDAVDIKTGHVSAHFQLRIARVNHDCDPNAAAFYDATHDVGILFSERAIEAGEEIAASYYPLNDITGDVVPSSEKRRSLLQAKWGITCNNESCFCRDELVAKLVGECIKLYQDSEKSLQEGNATAALAALDKILGNLDPIHATSMNRIGVLNCCFYVAVGRRSTLEEAKQYAQRAYEIASAIHHPNNENVQKYKSYVENPECHANYLRWE